LDNIVMMALRKDPARRYPSVEQLSEDIRRYLAGLPVAARADTFVYRAGKFVRRHRVAVAAAALVLLSLLGGILATPRAARQARSERARANRPETKRFQVEYPRRRKMKKQTLCRIALSVLFLFFGKLPASAHSLEQRFSIDTVSSVRRLRESMAGGWSNAKPRATVRRVCAP